MNLRTLMTERILYAVDPETLAEEFNITVLEIDELSDLDFLELFEDVTTFMG